MSNVQRPTMCQELTQSNGRERNAVQLEHHRYVCVIKWNHMKLLLLSHFLPIKWKIHLSQPDYVPGAEGEQG